MIWGLPGFLGFITIKEYASAIKYPKFIMFISIIALPINATLNYLLIYGFFIFEPLGISGAGYASAIVDWLMFISLMHIITIKNKKIQILFKIKNTLQFSIIKEMLKIGFPVGIMFSCEIALFSIIAIIMGRFGIHTLAAHQITIQISSLSFIFFLGIAQATGIKIAHASRKKNIKEIKKINKIGIQLNLLITITYTIILYIFPKNITNIFIDVNISTNKDILDSTVNFIYIIAIYQIFDSLQTIINSSLRNLKDTFFPMWLGIISWSIGLGCGFLLSYCFNLTSIGLWIGITIGIIILSFLLLIRFFYKIHKLKYNII